MLNERAAEHIYMAAGLLGVFGGRKVAARSPIKQLQPQLIGHPHALPAA
jgi:hypothetical protein